MAGEMTPLERLEAAIRLEPVDRAPICPMVDFFAARFTGLSAERFINDPDACEAALVGCFERLGGWDVTYNALLRPPFAFAMAELCRMKLPGRELPPDEVWQFDERPVMTPEDYDAIAENGLTRFLLSDYLPRILPEVVPAEVPARLKSGTALIGAAVERWSARGVPTLRVAGTTTPFEAFSRGRSLPEFAYDLYRDPGRVEAAMGVATVEMARSAIATARETGVPRVFIAGSRGAGQFLSSSQFERFYLPYLREMVTSMIREGLVPLLHFDHDWTRNLEYLREFPKGSCILQLDGFTDMHRAKEVLGGHMCLMGDVPPTLLTLGSVSEVRDYTLRLMSEVGRDGGFILSSGCSVPIDARPENVRAFIEAGKTYRAG